MTKIFFALFSLSLLFSTPLLAAECVDEKGRDIFNQPELFIPLIEQSKNCLEASKLADACAWGSSLDMTTAGAAYIVCNQELESLKPEKSLLDLLENMEMICSKKYEDEEGTMYLSMNAYCHLNAINWIVGVATPN